MPEILSHQAPSVGREEKVGGRARKLHEETGKIHPKEVATDFVK